MSYLDKLPILTPELFILSTIIYNFIFSKKSCHTQCEHTHIQMPFCHYSLYLHKKQECKSTGKRKIFMHTITDYSPSECSIEIFQLLCCNKKDQYNFQTVDPCWFKIFSVKNRHQKWTSTRNTLSYNLCLDKHTIGFHTV